tara:strand:- start:661 stop:1569 length:909 start_codon:yes stop_codon:yes gene_type:complete
MFEKIIYSLKIIINTEKIIYLFIPLFLFYFLKKMKNRNLVLILAILFFEPILIFALAENVIPQLRYFSGIITLIFILSAIIINDLSKFYKTKTLIILFIIFNFGLIYQKSDLNIKLKNILTDNHSFIKFYEQNKNINQNVLYLIPNLDNRKNLKNLELYKNLHEKNIIHNKLFQKDNYNFILKKIGKQSVNKNSFSREQTRYLNVFNFSLFDIKNYENFFIEVKEKYNYVVIQQNNHNSLELNNYIKDNFNLETILFNDSQIYFNNGIRDIFKYLYNGGAVDKLNKKFILGNNYALYRLIKM